MATQTQMTMPMQEPKAAPHTPTRSTPSMMNSPTAHSADMATLRHMLVLMRPQMRR